MDPKLLFSIQQPYLFQELPFHYSILFQNVEKIEDALGSAQILHLFKVLVQQGFSKYGYLGKLEELRMSLFRTTCLKGEGQGRDGLVIYKEGENNQVFQSLSKVKAMMARTQHQLGQLPENCLGSYSAVLETGRKHQPDPISTSSERDLIGSSISTASNKVCNVLSALFSSIEKDPVFLESDRHIVSDRVGSLLYEMARTELVKLQDDLREHDCLLGNHPITDEGWKVLFPDGLNTKKPVVEPKVKKAFKTPKGKWPKSNPM
ncbi:hypothetical protein BYT27DRAFT_7213407 [Phlegmacium glaucopus]|nr:hypothetical protein BYT27DRAFT_7213407 [Phlegmacium glaucopus]